MSNVLKEAIATTILDVSANTAGDTYEAHRWSKLVCEVTLTGTVTLEIQGRIPGGTWQTLDTYTSDGVSTIDNYWYQIRAKSSGMSGATAIVKAYAKR